VGITFTWSNIDKNSGIVATQTGRVGFSHGIKNEIARKKQKDSFMVKQASPSVQRISTMELWIPALFKLKK